MYGTARATSATAGGGAGLTRTATARRIAACLVLLALLVLLAGCAAAAHPAQSAAAIGPHCQREKIPVRLSAGASVTYRIAGWLCADGSPQGHTVEVLIPGLSYGASYWNFPVDPARYSYVRASAGKDAKFADAGLPAGYVTTKPGTRGADFFSPGYASPAVIKEDESLKQTVSAGELKTVVIPVPRAATQAIQRSQPPAPQRPETAPLHALRQILCTAANPDHRDELVGQRAIWACLSGKSMTYLSRSTSNVNHRRGSNASLTQG